MTRDQFDNLQIGDRVMYSLGHLGVVTYKDDMTYTVKDPHLDQGDSVDEVSFAWNEGELLTEEELKNSMVLTNPYLRGDWDPFTIPKRSPRDRLDEKHIDFKLEYELIKQKKSKLSRAERDYIIQVMSIRKL